jgi:hypothetical protein
MPNVYLRHIREGDFPFWPIFEAFKQNVSLRVEIGSNGQGKNGKNQKS